MDGNAIIGTALDTYLRNQVPPSRQSLERALELAPTQPNGFGRTDVRRVERFSEFLDSDFTHHAFVVELKDDRRVFLEVTCDDSTSDRREHVQIEPMPDSVGDGAITLTPSYPGVDSAQAGSWCDDVDHLNEVLVAG